MKDGAVSVVSISPDLTADQRKVVDTAIADITAGKFHPMTGPITSQDGELKLKPDETMADGPLLGNQLAGQGRRNPHSQIGQSDVACGPRRPYKTGSETLP